MRPTVTVGTIVVLICLMGYGEPFFYKQLYPNTKISRQTVPANKKLWTASYPDYNPPYYTAPCNSECDPDSPEGIVFGQFLSNSTRRSWAGRYEVSANNYPLNPRGRTGLTGRGALPRWGPNHMSMIVITRNHGSEILLRKTESNQTKPVLLMAATESKQNNPIPPAMFKNFKEELQKYFDITQIVRIMYLARKSSKQLFQDYFSDEVNTDNAWTELAIYTVDDPLARHIGRMKFNDSDSKYEWKKYEKNVVDQMLKSLMLISDMRFEDKVRHKFRTSLWSMKKRKFGEWVVSIGFVIRVGLKFLSVLKPIMIMSG